MKVVVTGGAGFIGSHICAVLKRAGFDVVALDNLERASPDGARRLEAEGVPLVRADLREGEIPPADAYIHAAYIDVAESWDKPYEYMVNNAATTAKVAKSAAHISYILAPPRCTASLNTCL